jgi:beta-lactamase class A
VTDDSAGLAGILESVRRSGAACVLDVDGPGQVALNSDDVVQTGSAFKIAVALEVYCQASAGELDLDDRLRFDAERAPVRDGTIEQAVDLMLRLSDNVATNVLLHRVTRDRIMARLTSLGLVHTTVSDDVLGEVADITARLDKLAQAAGFANWEQPSELVQAGEYEQVADRLARIRVDEHSLPHNQMGPTTTARELATLYRLIWQGQAGPADACAAVREAASHQQLQRLALGFDTTTGIRIAGKGGRVPGVLLNDAGVITYPDGRRYAAAVFTRAQRAFDGELASYSLIGTIAATAIGELRNKSS